MALNSLICADALLRNCSLTHSHTHARADTHRQMQLTNQLTEFRLSTSQLTNGTVQETIDDIMCTFLCILSACYAMRSVMSQINEYDDDDERT